MRTEAKRAALEVLRGRIGGGAPAGRGTLPFGVPALDRHLPGGGLSRGALHEVAGLAAHPAHDAAATLFAAGVAARLDGAVLWCLASPDLFAPALAGVGLHPDRVIYAELGGTKPVLLAMEDALRHAGLAAVVGEVARLDLTASRRLQLAAERSGTPALALRPQRAPDLAAPLAAVTRWRIGPLPSAGGDGEPGRPRWRVELLRCRGGETGSWVLEGCDAQGRLGVPAVVADRPAAPARRGAAG